MTTWTCQQSSGGAETNWESRKPELANQAGITARQVARYESGEQQPVLSVAVRMAEALAISLEELAGQLDDDIDLAGEWWAGWQTQKDGVIRHAIQKVTANHHGRHVNPSSQPNEPDPSKKAATTGSVSSQSGTARPSWAGTEAWTATSNPKAPCTSPSTATATSPVEADGLA